MKPRYVSDIEISCLVDEDDVNLAQTNNAVINNLHPIKFRAREAEEQHWISVNWINSNNELQACDSAATREVVTKKLKDLKPIFEALKISCDGTHGGNMKWTHPDMELTNGQRKISRAFLVDMANARGRGMATYLAQILLGEDPNIIVNNMGGRSKKDPLVKNIWFDPIQYFEEENSSPDIKRANLSSAEKPTVIHKTYVPDVIVEQVSRLDETCKEILNISIKCGYILTEKDFRQLKYELLPLMIKQDQAIGLLICAGSAQLLKAAQDSTGKVGFKQKSYMFTEGRLFQEFSAMCEDIIFHGRSF